MKNDPSTCPVCFSEAEVQPANGKDAFIVTCPRCGSFSITGSAEPTFRSGAEMGQDGEPLLGQRNSKKRAFAASWIRENKPNLLSSNDCVRLSSLTAPSMIERLHKLILLLQKAQDTTNSWVRCDKPADVAATWSLNNDDLNGLLKLTLERGLIRDKHGSHDPEKMIPVIRLTATGWNLVDQLSLPNPNSQQGFVAMWFDPPMEKICDEAIEPAIKAAGYHPHRVDRQDFEGRIDDEIIAQIRRSRFVVADLTGERPSAYYEAGLAHGLGLRVFFSAEEKTKLHFDIRQHNTIFWTKENMGEFRQRLQNRIESVLGRGPLATN